MLIVILSISGNAIFPKFLIYLVNIYSTIPSSCFDDFLSSTYPFNNTTDKHNLSTRFSTAITSV